MSEIISFRTFTSRPEQSVRMIHSPFTPAEVYRNESITAAIRLPGNSQGHALDIPVFRISPLGVELDLSNDDFKPITSSLSPGSELDLVLRVGRFNHEFSGLIVTTRHKEGTRELCGIRWCERIDSGERSAERRKARRWICTEEFLPTGIAPNPVRFNDYIHFRIVDFSVSGIQIATSLRNKFLVPGMVLEAMTTFPLVGQLALTFQIKNARIRSLGGKDYLALGATLSNVDRPVLQAMGEYMLQFGSGVTAADVRQIGFHATTVSKAIDFSYVKTAQDYRDVLELRRSAYSSAGKFRPNIVAEDAADVFDTRARILTARYKNTLVASMRMMFHGVDEHTEHEQFVKLPSWFPRKDEYIEVTRICTHKDFRGSDLLYALIKHMTITVIQSKRRWVMGSATAKMLPVYAKIGYKATGIKFKHETLGGEEHEVILGEVPRIVAGVGVGPTLWNEMYSDVVSNLRLVHGIEFEPLMNLRIAVYSRLKPFTKFLTRRICNPRPVKDKFPKVSL